MYHPSLRYGVPQGQTVTPTWKVRPAADPKFKVYLPRQLWALHIRDRDVLAHEEWGVLLTVPKIRMEKEPEGRIRWLGQHAPDEEQRLLAACAKSRNRELAAIVTVAWSAPHSSAQAGS